MSSSATPTPAVILVDDDFDFLLLLHRMVQHAVGDYEILTAGSGVEALNLFESVPVPLLLTDYNMADMNGLQLAARVKARWPHTAIVMITAFDTPELERQARLVGVDHFLPKPIQLDRLEQLVRRLLARS